MYSKIATSIVAFAALIAGTISPTGICALMCETHSRAQAHRHCGEDSDQMPRMAHNHAAMHHSIVAATTFATGTQSCKTGCAIVERLNISRKVVLRVTAVQTGAAVLDASSRFSTPHLESAWSLDTGPPSLPSSYPAVYRILRI